MPAIASDDPKWRLLTFGRLLKYPRAHYKASDPENGFRPLKKGIRTMPKKKQPKKRHPHVTRAIAHIEKLQQGHKKMILDLEKAKSALKATPFDTPFANQ
jgi:hypothetical protein